METTLAPIVVDARYLEKRFNMSRIYSNYDNADYSDIMVMAKSLGFSASAFQKYCVMLYLKHNIKKQEKQYIFISTHSRYDDCIKFNEKKFCTIYCVFII